MSQELKYCDQHSEFDKHIGELQSDEKGFFRVVLGSKRYQLVDDPEMDLIINRHVVETMLHEKAPN